MSDASTQHEPSAVESSVREELQALKTRVAELESQRNDAIDALAEYTGVCRRTLLRVVAGGAGAGALGVLGTGAASADASTSDGDGDVGTPNNRVDAFLDGADLVSLEGSATGAAGTITNMTGDGLFVSNGDLQVMPDVLQDGDGTSRDVWVIANGASDPAGASTGDLIFEEES